MDAASPLSAMLRSHYLFSGLDQEDFDKLVSGVSAKTLEKGEVLFHRGDEAKSFYFIDTGLIELSLIAATGEAKVRLELPRHVIASRLSIQPETLSRLLRNMTDEGILTIEDRVIFVHSLARLRPYD